MLPQLEGTPIKLVVPILLQMGWIESLPYFYAASETACDLADDYIETPVGSLPRHKFIQHSTQVTDFEALPVISEDKKMAYVVEAFVDDYIAIAILTSQEQLKHSATAVMSGIHDVFPEDSAEANNPISLKKMEYLEAMWALE